MPRTPEQNQNIKDRRRTKLLSFALKAFAANGYDKTAVDDIARPAKCSHGLFYHYFKSKEEVFSVIIREFLTGPYELPIQKALKLGGCDGLHLIAEYIEHVCKAGGKEIAIAKITLSLSIATTLDNEGQKFAASHDLRSALVTLIKQGQSEGKVIEGKPKDLALIATDALQGCLARLNSKSDDTVPSADLLCRLLMK